MRLNLVVPESPNIWGTSTTPYGFYGLYLWPLCDTAVCWTLSQPAWKRTDYAEQSVRLKGNHSQCSSARRLSLAVRRPWELNALQRKEANASAQSRSKLIKHPQHFHNACTALRRKLRHSKKIPKIWKHAANAKIHKHCRTVSEKKTTTTLATNICNERYRITQIKCEKCFNTADGRL